MPDTTSQYQIQIDVRARLDELALMQAQFQETRVEAEAVGRLFERGLGAGSGLEAAYRNAGYVADAMRLALAEAARLAAQLRDVGRAADEARPGVAAVLAPPKPPAPAPAAAGDDGPLASFMKGIDAGKMASSIIKQLGAALKGLVEAGGVRAAAAGLGRVAGGAVFGAFAVGLSAFFLSEFQRFDREAKARAATFDQAAQTRVAELRGRMAGVSSQHDVLQVKNDATKEALDVRKQLAELEKDLVPSEETSDRIASLKRELQGLQALLVTQPEELDRIIQKNRELKESQAALLEADYDLARMKQMLQEIDARDDLSPLEKRTEKIGALGVMIDAENVKIADATAKLAALGRTKDQIARDPALRQLIHERDLLAAQRDNVAFPQSDFGKTKQAFGDLQAGEHANGGKLLTVSQGPMAGLMSWSTQLGSVGQQISGSIGSALNSVSDSLVGLITKTKSWGDLWRSVGMIGLQTLVHLGTQMAVNAVIHAVTEGKMTAASAAGAGTRGAIGSGETAAHLTQTALKTTAHAAGEGHQTAATGAGALGRGAIRIGETIVHIVQTVLRTAAHVASETFQTAATIAQSAVRTAAVIAESLVYLVKAAFGAMSAVASIPYVGPILAIAAMAAIVAAGAKLLKGHAEGGYTGDGGKYEPAGLVHRGEVVFSQADVARHGGVSAVESLRLNPRSLGVVGPGAAGAGAASFGGRAAAAPQAAKPTRFVHVMAPDLVSARRLSRDPEFDNVMLNWAQRRRGQLFQAPS